MKFNCLVLCLFLLLGNSLAVLTRSGVTLSSNLEPVVGALLSSYEEWIVSPDFAVVPRLNDFEFSYTEQIYLKRNASIKLSKVKRGENILRSLKDAANRANLVRRFNQPRAKVGIYKGPFETIKAYYLIKELSLTKHVTLLDRMMKLTSEESAVAVAAALNEETFKSTQEIKSVLEFLKSGDEEINEETIRSILSLSSATVSGLLSLFDREDGSSSGLVLVDIADQIASANPDRDQSIDLAALIIRLFRNHKDTSRSLLETLSLVDRAEIGKIYEIYKWTDILDDAIIEACLANDDILEGSYEIIQIAEIKRLTSALRESDKLALDEERTKRYLTLDCAKELRRSANNFLSNGDVRKILRSHGILKKPSRK